jgi:hypothetical protein
MSGPHPRRPQWADQSVYPSAAVKRSALLVHRAQVLQRNAAGAVRQARKLRGEVFCVPLPRGLGSGAHARRLLERHLVEEPGATVEDAKLIASELINNAVVHGAGSIRPRLSRPPGRLRIEVIDDGENATVRMLEPGGDGGGRGFRIVNGLAHRWGARDGTTHVWAELRCPPSSRWLPASAEGA